MGKAADITKLQNFAVIIRAIHERGESQQQALDELRARGLWLSDEQKVQAGLASPEPAPPYDFAVLDNAEQPRSMVYHLDTGAEVATFGIDDHGQAMAERVCETLNAYCKEHGIS